MLTAPRPQTESRPSAGRGAGRRSGTSKRSTAEDWPSFALAILTCASAVGFARVFIGRSWVVPVMLTALAAHAACWVLRSYRVKPIIAWPAAIAAMVLMMIWTIFTASTSVGFPGPKTWHHIGDAITYLRQNFDSSATPVIATPGFKMIAALGAGVMALLGDWIVFRWKSALIGMTPALALFIACCGSGTGGGRMLMIGVEVVAAATFVLADRLGRAEADQVWFAGVRTGAPSWLFGMGSVGIGLALLSALAITPFLSKQDGVGALGWRTFGPGDNGAREVANPIVTLQSRLLDPSNAPIFTVNSPVSSYWRLTSLDQFDGVLWTGVGSYRGYGVKLPGIGNIPNQTQTVVDNFKIQNLDSPWLPDSFTPVQVTGVHGISYDPSTNSLLTGKSSSNGLRYTVTAYQYLNSLTPAQLQAAPAIDPHDQNLSDNDFSYPSLPGIADISGRVQAITQGKTTEYDQALAIQNYLRNSGFRYTLNPPNLSDPNQKGAELYNFLFKIRAGYCQQFASAFAVMARIIGLPTRLAVGFSTGTVNSAGDYEVLNRNAHTWPEVWFGPSYGWVPFEPTPGFDNPSASGYTGTSGTATAPTGGGPTGGSLAPTTTSTTSTTIDTTPTTHRPQSSTSSPPTTLFHRTVHSGGGGPSVGTYVLGGLVAAVGLWAGLNSSLRSVRRRRRLARAHSSGSAAYVLALWDDVAALLEWRGIKREPADTDNEYARKAAYKLNKSPVGDTWQHGGLRAMATLARQASFAATVPEQLGEHAERAAGEVRARIMTTATFGWKVGRAFKLPPGTAKRWAANLRDLNARIANWKDGVIRRMPGGTTPEAS